MSELPLTDKKKRWAKNRDVVLRGNKLANNAALELRYKRELDKLVKTMTLETNKKLRKLFKDDTAKAFIKQQKQAIALDANLGSQAKKIMNYLTNKFTRLFALKATNLAEQMLNGAEMTSKTALHGSLKELSGGLSLKTGIIPKGYEDIGKAIIAENVSLIKSIPEKYLGDVTGSVMRSITTGKGMADLVPEILKYDGQTYRKAKLIALDQTRKAYQTINKQKLVALGVKRFEWKHTRGSVSPRESHEKISGHIFTFENLEAEQTALGVPERDRGLPGYPVSCRCVIRPIIEFAQ
jgi:uncharacterized protein with gpF-like domain